MSEVDVAIIGGGVYGCYAAEHLLEADQSLSIAIIDEQDHLFAAASSKNQRRLHEGYFYSSNPETADECRRNAEQFRDEFGEAVNEDTVAYYGIHRDSSIPASSFESFCEDRKLPLEEVPVGTSGIFTDVITHAYRTDEKTFSSTALKGILARRMLRLGGVHQALGEKAKKLRVEDNGKKHVETEQHVFEAAHVINAAFAGIRGFHERSNLSPVGLDRQITLQQILRTPEHFHGVAASVLWGEYASLLPGEAPNSHSLAAVPFMNVTQLPRAGSGQFPDEQLEAYNREALRVGKSLLLPLQGAVLEDNVIASRVAVVDEDGHMGRKARFLPDFDGIEGYHVLVGGKVTCVHEIGDLVVKRVINSHEAAPPVPTSA